MSHSVWKYEIKVGPEFAHTMPMLAQVLHVDVQDGVPCMWVRVNPSNEQVERTFYVHGTGHEVPAELTHLGSFMLHGGRFVGHLFEHPLARMVES